MQRHVLQYLDAIVREMEYPIATLFLETLCYNVVRFWRQWALPMLEKQLQEANSSIDNMLNAIQQGVLTKSTKQRLEDRRHELFDALRRDRRDHPYTATPPADA